MKLVVGLGNVGRKYDKTRHNVGFDVVERLAAKFAVASPRGRFQGETIDAEIGGEKVLLLRPHTYMNLSGTSVQPARDFFKIEIGDILVVCDDFNLPSGKLRLRAKGSAGGQKGLADIIQRLGTDEVPRLRVGIGPVPPQWNAADFVLSRFSADEVPVMKETLDQAGAAVVDWATQGVAYCMNRYNA